MKIARRPGAVVAILLLLTFLKVGGFLLLSASDKIHAFVGSNALHHFIPIAKRLVAEGRFNGPDSRPDSKAPPGYPPLVALSMVLAPIRYLDLLVALQMLMDLVTAIAIYWIACDWNRSEAGLLGAVAWLLFPPAVVISTWITAEIPFTCLFIVGTRYLLLGLRDGKLRFALLAGVLMALAIFQRATPMYMIPALLPVFLWTHRIRLWIAFALVSAVIVCTWTARNWIVLHDFIPVSVGSGAILMMGSDERIFTIQGKHDNYPILFAEAAAGGITRPDTDKESQIDGYMGRVGIWLYKDRLRHRPLSLITLFTKKFVRLWYANESDSMRTEILLGICSLSVLPGAILGWLHWRKARPVLAWFVFTVVAYFVVVHVAVYPEFRYALPLFPLLLLAAGDGYGRLLRVLV